MRDFFHHVFIGTVCKVHNQSSVCIQPNPPPRPFPVMGKGAALEDIPPPRRQEIEQPGPSVKGKPPQKRRWGRTLG